MNQDQEQQNQEIGQVEQDQGEEFIFLPLENTELESSEEEEEEQFDFFSCPICLSMMQDKNHRPMFLPCGHVFGHSCLNNWFKQTWKYCPVCKEDANMNKAQFLYIDLSFIKDYQSTKKDMSKLTQEIEDYKLLVGLQENEIKKREKEYEDVIHMNALLDADKDALLEEIKLSSKKRKI